MAIGAGKYNEFALDVKDQTEAAAVFLGVIDGNRGSGFAIESSRPITPAIVDFLREIAAKLEADIALNAANSMHDNNGV